MLSERKKKKWSSILDSYVKYKWIMFWIDLGCHWYFVSRFWEGASASLGHRYFSIPKNRFIVYFLELDNDDELFVQNSWQTKGFKPYIQLGSLSEILIITNLRTAASRFSTCADMVKWRCTVIITTNLSTT